MRIVIVDGTTHMRERVKTLLYVYTRDTDVVEEACEAQAAIWLIRERCQNVVLLDLQLARASRFEVLRMVGEHPPRAGSAVETQF